MLIRLPFDGFYLLHGVQALFQCRYSPCYRRVRLHYAIAPHDTDFQWLRSFILMNSNRSTPGQRDQARLLKPWLSINHRLHQNLNAFKARAHWSESPKDIRSTNLGSQRAYFRHSTSGGSKTVNPTVGCWRTNATALVLSALTYGSQNQGNIPISDPTPKQLPRSPRRAPSPPELPPAVSSL